MKGELEKSIFIKACEVLAANKKSLLSLIYVPKKDDIFSEKYVKLDSERNYIKYEKNLVTLSNGFDSETFESTIKELKFKVPFSFELPHNLYEQEDEEAEDHNEHIEFINKQGEKLAKAIEDTLNEVFRFFFTTSFFDSCLPNDEYEDLLNKTFFPFSFPLPSIRPKQRPTIYETSIYDHLVKFMIQNRDQLKALSYEINKKISNKFIYDVEEVIYAERKFRFTPFNRWEADNPQNIYQLKKCIKNCEHLAVDRVEKKYLKSNRKKSLKALEVAIISIAEMTEEISHMWLSTNEGNVDNSVQESSKSKTFPYNRGIRKLNKSTILNCTKENRILIISKADYRDFVSGDFKTRLLAQWKTEINWGKVTSLFSEIIPLVDVPCGHAFILDKRMLACMLSLDSSGNKWINFGLLDEFVGLRIQMAGFIGAPINIKNILFQKSHIDLPSDEVEKKAIHYLIQTLKFLGRTTRKGFILVSKLWKKDKKVKKEVPIDEVTAVTMPEEDTTDNTTDNQS